MSPEQNITLDNFRQSLNVPDIVKLKEANTHVGWGAICIIINERGELLITTSSPQEVRSGEIKSHKLGPVYETGNIHDADPLMTLLAGVASELGIETLNKLGRYHGRSYTYDFHQKPGDKPSLSFISVCHLNSADLPNKHSLGSEIMAVEWMSLDKVLSLSPENVRKNFLEIINYLASLDQLRPDAGACLPITQTNAITPTFLALRTPDTDVFWS